MVGDNLTIAARDTYEVRALALSTHHSSSATSTRFSIVLRAPLGTITVDAGRYPDDVLLALLLEHTDDHLRAQTRCALEDALQRVT